MEKKPSDSLGPAYLPYSKLTLFPDCPGLPEMPLPHFLYLPPCLPCVSLLLLQSSLESLSLHLCPGSESIQGQSRAGPTKEKLTPPLVPLRSLPDVLEGRGPRLKYAMNVVKAQNMCSLSSCHSSRCISDHLRTALTGISVNWPKPLIVQHLI